MKLKIKDAPEEEKEVTFELVQYDDGSINVKADGFYVLKFTTNGEVRMTGCVPPRLGFKLTRRGSVRIYKEGINE